MTEPTPGLWTATEMGGKDSIPIYIKIEGPSGEMVCNLYPHAAFGGQGVDVCRANAALILAARNGAKP